MTKNILQKPLRFIFTLFLALVLLVGQALAVDEGKVSYTAEAVCAFRAIGATDPDPMTRNPDHMATLFVNPAMEQHFPGLGLDYPDAKVAMDQMNSGVFYYVNARTHHMDAALVRALKDGFRQVVIMGAGFDSRAYRFHVAYPDVRFFEIDLPATSADKQRRVTKILGRIPDWVNYVPIDFNTQTLDEVLGHNGFARDQKTFYVWEGVTYYIARAGVESTLEFVAEKSAAGSRIVFDYMLADVVYGRDYSAYGARRIVYHVARRGEPYIFGIDPQKVEGFVNRHGLALSSDLGPQDLSRRYLIRSNGSTSGKISEFLRIALAQVPTADERQSLKKKVKDQGAIMAPEDQAAPLSHLVEVGDDVQEFLDTYSNSLLNKDYYRLKDCFSAGYKSNGRGRDQIVAFIKQGVARRPPQQHKIILTQFQQDGDHAKVDGFIQCKGHRIPLMVHDIIKETDGRWRWFGNQQ